MQRGGRGGGRDDFFDFGDPFGSFGGHRSLVSSFFGGRDPFDDSFFNRPFGSSSMLGPSMFGSSSMLGPSMFGSSSMFGGQNPSLFGDSPASGFIDNRPSQPNRSNRSSGPIIEELSSGDEGEEHHDGVKKENPRKHSRSGGEPYVEEPDDGAEERRIRHMQHRNEYNRANGGQPQTRTFSFQSSTVTYGGANGAYYTSSTTRKMGDNGVMLEEKKEADTTTGKAEHKISKGIHDKGHTLTRKLNPDGKVDMMQTLHNLEEDELAGFEENWKGNAKKHLPGWTENNDVSGNIGPSSSRQGSRQGWALPSTEQPSVPNGSTSHRANPYRRRH